MNVQRYFSLEFTTGILNGGVGMMIYLEVPNPPRKQEDGQKSDF